MSEQENNIENYLLGKLSQEELSAFENRLEGDADLRKMVAQEQAIYDALETEVESRLRDDLNKMEASSQTLIHRGPSLRWILAAAAIILVAGASIWLLASYPGDWQSYVSEEYMGYDFEGVRSSGLLTFATPLEQARRGEYPAAITYLETHLESAPQDYEAQFLLAHIHQMAGQSERAADAFKKIATGESILWAPRAAWNYLLIRGPDRWDVEDLKMINDIENNRDHPFHEKVKKMRRHAR